MNKKLEKTLKEAGRHFAPKPSDLNALKNRVLKSISVTPQVKRRYINWSKILKVKRGVAMPIIPVLLAIVLAGAGATAVVADEAKPGDTLYGVDQAMEQIQEKLTFTPELQERLQLRLADERLREYVGLQNAAENAPNEEVRERLLALREQLKERFQAQIERLEDRLGGLQAKLEETDDPVVEKRLTHLTERLNQMIEHQGEVVEKIVEGKLPSLREKLNQTEERLGERLERHLETKQKLQEEGKRVPLPLEEIIKGEEKALEKLEGRVQGKLPPVDEESSLIRTRV